MIQENDIALYIYQGGCESEWQRANPLVCRILDQALSLTKGLDRRLRCRLVLVLRNIKAELCMPVWDG
jgi:hypothetical protein